MKLCYYISGHGLGHASRSGQIINTLLQRHPHISVEVVSDAHAWFLAGFLDPSVTVRRRRLDIGVIQRDSLEMDPAATLRAWQFLSRQREAIVAEEAARLAAGGVRLVVADIPAMAFAGAQRAGVPAVAVGNFSWDWIYAGMAETNPGFAGLAAAQAADYALATGWLQLPFAGSSGAFTRIEELPLVARQGRTSVEQTRRTLGVAPGVMVGLISFGGFGLGGTHLESLQELTDWVFVGETPLAPIPNLRVVPPGRFAYPDLVRAADVVITKPGYGIVSETIANGTAVLYSRRGEFREQDLLIEGLHRYCRAREIDNEALRCGSWGPALSALLSQPVPRHALAVNGAEVAADRLAQIAQNGSW